MWYVMQVRTGTEENIRCQCQRLIREHPLPVSAVNKQQCLRTLLYPILPTEETISGRMAYPGKNPLSRVCLFNCSKSGMSVRKSQKSHRNDQVAGNRGRYHSIISGRSKPASETGKGRTISSHVHRDHRE